MPLFFLVNNITAHKPICKSQKQNILNSRYLFFTKSYLLYSPVCPSFSFPTSITLVLATDISLGLQYQSLSWFLQVGFAFPPICLPHVLARDRSKARIRCYLTLQWLSKTLGKMIFSSYKKAPPYPVLIFQCGSHHLSLLVFTPVCNPPPTECG